MFGQSSRSTRLCAIAFLAVVTCARFGYAEPPHALLDAVRGDGSAIGERGGARAKLRNLEANGVEVDYRSANLLSHADLTGAQLRKAKLTGGLKAFYETKFDSADLTEARLTGSAAFQKASFKHAKLAGATFDGGVASFQKARFDDANLVGARLVGGGSSFQEASFAQANLTGALLKGEGTALQLVNLDGANCTDLQVICTSAAAAFQVASLNDTRFAGADLSSLAWQSLKSCVFDSRHPPSYDDRTRFPDGFDPVKQGWKLLSAN